MDADGGNLARWWGGGEANEFSPDWSPDGSRIAYWSCVSGPAPCRIHVVSGTAEGGVAWDLTADMLISGRLDWSPDGQRIVFERCDYGAAGNCSISLMDADGRNVAQLTDSQVSAYQPAWSSDGRYIAFVSEGDLYVMDADGQNVLRLTSGEGNIVWPD